MEGLRAGGPAEWGLVECWARAWLPGSNTRRAPRWPPPTRLTRAHLRRSTEGYPNTTSLSWRQVQP